MKIPTIHSNGTGAASLIAEVNEALGAVQKAYKAVGDMTVNDRDYYTQEAGALVIAEREHKARLAMLRFIETELSEYYDGLVKQQR